jgi:hypothetical protein
MKMLQPHFDWDCSWTVLVTARYRPRLASADFTLNMNWQITSVDVFILRLSWNLQFDTLLPFHEKRHITPRLKIACALKTRIKWVKLNKMKFWEGIGGYEACIPQINCQKTQLKSRHYTTDKLSKDTIKKQTLPLRVIKQYLSETYCLF